MSIQSVTNVVDNPRHGNNSAALSASGAEWQGGFGDDAGHGAGGVADWSLTGGPSASIPSYAKFTATIGPLTTNNMGMDFGLFPIKPGETYALGGYGWISAASVCNISVIFYNTNVPSLTARIGEIKAPQTSIAANTWQNQDLTVIAPPEATWAAIVTTFKPTFTPGDFFPAGSYEFRSTGFYMVAQSDLGVPYTGGYFDGDFAAAGVATYSWAGTAQLSRSYTVFTTPDPPIFSASSAVVNPVSGNRSFRRLNLIDFSAVEDSTPIDPSDTTGGVSQFTFNVPENDQTGYLLNLPIDLVDNRQGITRGTIKGIESQDKSVTLTADSRLAQLAVDRVAQPFVGTLEDAFLYYLDLCGITTGIVIDPTVGAQSVVYQGFSGNVWDEMKKIATSSRCEISLVSNNVVLRPLRERNAEIYRDTSRSWALDTTQLARTIEIYYYNNVSQTSTLAYPLDLLNDETIQTVEAGETKTFTMQLNSSLSFIQQPTMVTTVARDYSASSRYSIIDKDGVAVAPSVWIAAGGTLSVAINDDTKTLTGTITGGFNLSNGPFQVASSDGDGDRWSSLRLIGDGVFFDKQLLVMETSVDHEQVSSEVGVTVDNERISTYDEAVSLGLWTLKRYGGPRHSISISTTGINTLGVSGNYRYPIIAELNSAQSGDTIADINTQYAGFTIADFNAYWNATVENDFANQALGNIGGARRRDRDAMFRIRSATTGPFGISYQAEEDTTIADINTLWAGKTIADFNAEWIGSAFSDINIGPLRKMN